MAPNWSAPAAGVDELSARKLETFERLEIEFGASFTLVQDMHGKRRFDDVPVALIVGYLHALWICERKDWLLSVPKTIPRYEGGASLRTLLAWQQGDEASVVSFLERKLDGLAFAPLSQRLQEARQSGDVAVAERLAHGRMILLNRAHNLTSLLDTLFSAPPGEMTSAVQEEAARLGHAPADIQRQLEDFKDPLYSYAPHPALARRNMQIMNRLGVRLTATEADHPGERTERVESSESPLPSYAQETIAGERTLSSMADNNPRQLDLAMPPLDVDDTPATDTDRS